MLTRNTILILTAYIITLSFSQNCPGAAFFNGQRCAPCASNCQCTQENTCTSCLAGYTYNALFTSCLQCPIALDAVNIGCKECCYQVQGPGFVCSSCASGNYIFQQGGQCLKVDGCTSLSSQGVCLACATGFYLSQGLCAICDSSCATCQDSSVCLTCASGYFNGTDVNHALCQACSTGCSTCTDASTCSACTAGYRLTTPTCTACPSNCESCSSGACLTCTSPAVLVGTSCYACTETSQQGSVGCTACTTTGVRIECSACSDGYYLDSATKTCLTCHSKFPNSVLCNFDQPLQCLDDAHATLTSRYYLVGSTCVSNTKNCKNMLDSSGTCSLCYFSATEGYYSLVGGVCTLCNVAGCLTYSSTCQCLSCQNGYQFINNQCNACQSLHCNVCQTTVTSCQTCAVSYGRESSACLLCSPSNCYNCDGDHTICATCNAGYYLNSGLCYACQANCASCISNVQCTSCQATHYLQNNGRCKVLPSNCVNIDTTTLSSNVGGCKRCQYGYILLDGNCYPCGLTLFNVKRCLFSWNCVMTNFAPTTTFPLPGNRPFKWPLWLSWLFLCSGYDLVTNKIYHFRTMFHPSSSSYFSFSSYSSVFSGFN